MPSIVRKGIPLQNFFQFFFLFLMIAVPLIASTRSIHPNLVIDSFETGIGAWIADGAPFVMSHIQEETRLSPEGSWHMVWKVENSCSKSPFGYWAIIDMVCPTTNFSLRDYKDISFWCKTEIGEYGFQLELRSPTYNNSFCKALGPSNKWEKVRLTLPRNGNPDNFTVVGQPDPEVCHIAFANSCNDTYHFDYIQLTSTTVIEQYSVWPVITTEIIFGSCLFYMLFFSDMPNPSNLKEEED